MYKIGVFGDVHGNDVALKKCLEKIQEVGVNEIISIGDLIAIGPNSNEVLEIVTKLENFSSVKGNHERYYIRGFSNPLSCTEASHQEWVKANIDEKYNDFIKNMPYRIEKIIEGIKIDFIHYPLRGEERFEYIVHNPTPYDLDMLFKDYDGEIICYGHEHIASFIQGKKLYLDPGSCGCPYPEKDETRFIILTIDKGHISYEHFKITYNSKVIVEDMYRKNMPEKEYISQNFYLIKKK